MPYPTILFYHQSTIFHYQYLSLPSFTFNLFPSLSSSAQLTLSRIIRMLNLHISALKSQWYPSSHLITSSPASIYTWSTWSTWSCWPISRTTFSCTVAHAARTGRRNLPQHEGTSGTKHENTHKCRKQLVREGFQINPTRTQGLGGIGWSEIHSGNMFNLFN